MLNPPAGAARPPTTLRSTATRSVATLVSMIAVLGVLAFGVTQYQRTLFESSMQRVQHTTGTLGALDRSVIVSAGSMLNVLYRPDQGATLEQDYDRYVRASDEVHSRFERAEQMLEGHSGSRELRAARETWTALDQVIRDAPDAYTDQELFALMAASNDPFVDPVWYRLDRLDGQLNKARSVTVGAMDSQTDDVNDLQRLFGPIVVVALGVAFVVALLTARRMARRVLAPLEALGRSARTMHDPDLYEPCTADGAVAEVQELARVVDQAARELHSHHQHLEHQALTDSLTSLPNREAFTRSLGAMLDDPDVDQVAVLFVDLDDFKRVNDTLGHAAGDELLRIVANRLQAATRQREAAARLGGDEFAVALRVDQDTVPTAVAERICAALDEPIHIDGQLVDAGCSIGIVVSDASDHDRTVDSMLGHADFAMYLAKSQGKGRYVLYGGDVPREQGGTTAALAGAEL